MIEYIIFKTEYTQLKIRFSRLIREGNRVIRVCFAFGQAKIRVCALLGSAWMFHEGVHLLLMQAALKWSLYIMCMHERGGGYSEWRRPLSNVLKHEMRTPVARKRRRKCKYAGNRGELDRNAFSRCCTMLRYTEKKHDTNNNCYISNAILLSVLIYSIQFV